MPRPLLVTVVLVVAGVVAALDVNNWLSAMAGAVCRAVGCHIDDSTAGVDNTGDTTHDEGGSKR